MKPDTAGLRAAYLAALRAGDELAARDVVERARNVGIEADRVYLEVFAPTMATIGELWERNELSVAEEHLATAITERLIAQLSPSFSQRGASPGRVVVLGCVEGERHALGLRMMADLFRQHGWRVLYLGADVPTRDWVSLAVRHNVDAVGISAGAYRHVPAVRALIEQLRAAHPELLILVGGAIFNTMPELWRDVGASLHHSDPYAAVAMLTARYALQSGRLIPAGGDV